MIATADALFNNMSLTTSMRMFCTPCSAFIDRWKQFVAASSNLTGSLTWEDYSEHLHDNLHAFQQSTAKGCRICLSIWLALDREEKECLPSSIRVILQVQPKVGERRPMFLALFMNGREKANIDSTSDSSISSREQIT
jgi:hypothetical protein